MSSHFIMDLLKKISEQAVIPVISLDIPDLIIPLLSIYEEFGIKCIEVTFRNKNTQKILEILNQNYSDFCYGVGTVRTMEHVNTAMKFKSKFIVTPGLNTDITKSILESGYKQYYPGIDSTLGIEEAQKFNLSILKFFPASVAGGPSFLKAMQGPYSDIKFIPTGGISLDNLDEYLSLNNVLAVGGSFLAPKKLIKTKNWDKIREICMKTQSKIKDIRD